MPDLQRTLHLVCTSVKFRTFLSTDFVLDIVRFSIPFNLAGLPAIENFLGRQKKLERLWHYLQPQTCNSRKVAILHGLGGIGKTQLAIRFARNHKDHFTAILWLRGKNRNALLQSLSSILPRLPGQTQASMAKNEDEVEQNARKVLKWLALPGNSRWLLIFDNVDNYSPVIEDGYDIREFFPTSDYGSILITSRLQSLAELGQSFPVPTFSSEEAISLLGQNRHLPIPDMISKEEVDQGIDLHSSLIFPTTLSNKSSYQ